MEFQERMESSEPAAIFRSRRSYIVYQRVLTRMSAQTRMVHTHVVYDTGGSEVRRCRDQRRKTAPTIQFLSSHYTTSNTLPPHFDLLTLFYLVPFPRTHAQFHFLTPTVRLS
ncbi:hypothetical protein M413DRAFT_398585 [Hebeloma cylindrosporum]|uniref:Uncharacterized protein n=1 Tax=Hebeloma cylindrosporum TaxID=76867 RepID=A0A0C2Y046_HEBCY|nr:hypothetical protein M413DRAFT_398585 [Hebeloma cylindrosporum h7]